VERERCNGIRCTSYNDTDLGLRRSQHRRRIFRNHCGSDLTFPSRFCPFPILFVSSVVDSWVKKFGGRKFWQTASANFRQRRLSSGAQNLNFAPKFSKNGDFQSPNFFILRSNFFDNKKIFRQAEIDGGGQLPRR